MPNILIVEDNEMNRDMLSRRLKRKGYDISIAVDGQEGLDVMRADRPSGAYGHGVACHGRLDSHL